VDRRVLFLETLKDLESRLQSDKSEYDAIKIAGILRQWLTDATPLVPLLCRGRNVMLRFRVRIESPPTDPMPVYWALADGFDPDTALTVGHASEVTKDQLLACNVIYINSVLYTVKDVIRQLAHVEGGVHAGTPEDERERQLTEWSRFARIGGRETTIYTILAIGRVVMKGLQPLKARLERELASGDPGPDILDKQTPKKRPKKKRRR